MAKAKAIAELHPLGADIGQIGAIPLIRTATGEYQVILVTTRGSGRWTIPKGNPIKGMPLHKAACVEALEEAGLVGRAKKEPLGTYQFWKRQEDHWLLATVLVFAMQVDRQLDDFKEKGEREVRAFSLIAAHDNVVEPGLQTLLRKLRKDPKLAAKKVATKAKAKAKPRAKQKPAAGEVPPKKKGQRKPATDTEQPIPRVEEELLQTVPGPKKTPATKKASAKKPPSGGAEKKAKGKKQGPKSAVKGSKK